MSVNLEFDFTVRNYRREDISKIIATITAFLTEEDLLAQGDMIVDCLGRDEKENICAYTTNPVIISGVSEWEPYISSKFKKLIADNYGPECKAEFVITSSDA